MSDYIDKIKATIDSMTHQIDEKIHAEAYDDASLLLVNRFDLIIELVSLVPNLGGNQSMQAYLSALKAHTDQLMRKVGKERDETRDNLKNCVNIKEYFNV